MRSANILSGAFCLCILLTGIAGAQTVTPGEEGELAKFLPPEPGRRICYARTYSAEHLKKHPQQTVTEVAFRLAYFRHEPDDFFPKGQRNYYFAMLAKQRGDGEDAVDLEGGADDREFLLARVPDAECPAYDDW
jgi:hypothetical protein